MSTLTTKGFSQIVGSIAAGMQGRITSRFLNFATGSALRGMAEAYAGVLLWMQKQAIDIVKQARLATSFGADVDTFVADFPLAGVTRLGAQAATGIVTFSRNTPSSAAPVIGVGTVVQTLDGSQRFQVYADATNGSYSASANGYVMPAQVASIDVPVGAAVAGSAGNVAAGQIALIGAGAPSGVDNVTNVAAFTNGIDVESDDSVKARFRLAVQARTGGTVAAIQSAVANLRVGMSCVVLENKDIVGNTVYGMNSVIVDDGSGAISSDLLTAAQVAVNDVRAAGIRNGVYAATIARANVTMQIATAPGVDHNIAVAKVVGAIGLYIDSIPQDAGLPYFSLIPVALSVPGVISVISYSLNNGTVDLAGSPLTTVKTGELEIS